MPGDLARRATATRREAADEPRYALIELMFFAYRDFVQDADRVLAADGFGRAHHRVLYFATRRPGLTVAELLDILKITKQSLNRVLKDLLDRGYVTNRLGEEDRRQRRLEATPVGAALIERIAAIQSARFTDAFARMGPDAETAAAAFLAAMTDAPALVTSDTRAPSFASGRTRPDEVGSDEGTLSLLNRRRRGGNLPHPAPLRETTPDQVPDRLFSRKREKDVPMRDD